MGSTGDDLETGGYFGFIYYASNQSVQLGFAISIPAVLCFISLDSLFVTWALRQSYLRLQFHKRVNKTNPIDYVYSRLYCRKEEARPIAWRSGERGCSGSSTGSQRSQFR